MKILNNFLERSDKIEKFNKWDEVCDYASDEFTVDLFNKKKQIIGRFYYSRFTLEDLIDLKKQFVIQK